MTRFPRLLRIAARILGALVLLVVLAWVALTWYISSHKKELLHTITEQLSERTGGNLAIRDMQPSFWKSFPNVSVRLTDVTLRDSMYRQHGHSLLDAKDLFVKLNSLSLLGGRTEIKKITAAHGKVFIFTDSNGYSNAYLFKSKKEVKDTSDKKKSTIVEAFGLEDIDLQMVHAIKHKLFHVLVRRLDGETEFAKGRYRVHLSTKAHVDQFCFNVIRGSFIKDQDLDIDIAITYNPKEKKLYVPEQEIKIGGTPLKITTIFDFSNTPSVFSMRLRSEKIKYKTAVSWQSNNIQKKLDAYDFNDPVAVDAQISGAMAYRSVPAIRVSYLINKNVLITKMGNVDDVSFTGFYFNETTPGIGHGDDNSQMQFRNVRGTYKSIPFTMDTLNVTNLLAPFLNARIRSSFPLAALNEAADVSAFTFKDGRAEADLHYVGGVLPQDTTPYTINGYVKVTEGALDYGPRALNFNQVRALIVFQQDDLSFRDVHLRSKSSSITMEGEALNFLQLYFKDPGKIVLAWRAKSPQIDLNDFTSFVGKRASGPKPVKPAAARNRIGTQLDKVLDESSIRIDATVDRLIYKNFLATGVSAHAALASSGIIIEKASLKNAGGTITVTGVINQDAQNNPFELKADLDKVNVAELFKGFDNFGQDAITSKNIRGRLTAQADVAGKMTEGAKLLPYSMNGKVNFRLEDGVLDHFAPLEKIGKLVFKKRNLEHVTFKDINNTLAIDGGRINIPPMTIESSAVNMHVAGDYVLPKGTDIAIAVPLRNPEKEEASTIFGKLMRKSGGIVVNLRARDEDGNGVKIAWDPLKRGQKKLDKAGEDDGKSKDK